MHACTDDEFKRFHEPENSDTAAKMTKLQREGELYCYDKEDQPLELFREDRDMARFMIDLWACGTEFELADGSRVGGTHSDCEPDL